MKRSSTILVVLIVLNLFNYIDRWVLAAMMPKIQTDLQLSNTMTGLILSAFMLGFFITSPVFGHLSSYFGRVKLMSVGTFLWGIATSLSYLMTSGVPLFWARSLVGIGEASTASCSQPLLIDYYPPKKRDIPIALLSAAIPVGSALGFILGGYLVVRVGWQKTFLYTGLLGVLMAVVLLFIKEPKPELKRTPKFFKDSMTLFRDPFYRNQVLGYTACTFTIGGFGSWIPLYITKTFSLSLDKTNLIFGIITVVTGTLGSIFGGFLSSSLRKKFELGPQWLVLVAVFITLPLSSLAFFTNNATVFFVTIGLSEFLLFLTHPIVNLTILECVPVAQRTLATSLCIFVMHLLGDLISPPLVGVIADQSDLRTGMLVLPLALIAAFWFYSRILIIKSQSS